MINYIYSFFGFWGLYFIAGMIYAVVNILIRKLPQKDDHFDPTLVLVWVGLWWMGVIALIFKNITKLFKKSTT